jgi:medium-chain acyl-[acyl-carrier-protein] hydrolase
MDFLQLTKEYPIHVYETGPDGKLNLFSLFDYLQDAASNHAVMLGYGKEDLIKNNNFWVLSRIYGEMLRMPEWGEKLTVKTWPRGTDKLFALRDFEVRGEKAELIALATSSWLIIDISTRRIQRPDYTLSSYKNVKLGGNALPRNANKLEAVISDGQPFNRFNVKVSDLDVNLHTNNVRYLKWTVDSYNLDFVMNHFPVSVEINYLAESRYNDEIAVITASDNANGCIFNHSILRMTDYTELCRIKILWKEEKTGS